MSGEQTDWKPVGKLESRSDQKGLDGITLGGPECEPKVLLGVESCGTAQLGVGRGMAASKRG